MDRKPKLTENQKYFNQFLSVIVKIASKTLESIKDRQSQLSYLQNTNVEREGLEYSQGRLEEILKYLQYQKES